MHKLTFTRKTSLVLHNEYYSNKGLSQDEIMERLKKIDGIYMVKKFPINSNIEVCLSSNSVMFISDVVLEIKLTLEDMIYELKEL